MTFAEARAHARTDRYRLRRRHEIAEHEKPPVDGAGDPRVGPPWRRRIPPAAPRRKPHPHGHRLWIGQPERLEDGRLLNGHGPVDRRLDVAWPCIPFALDPLR